MLPLKIKNSTLSDTSRLRLEDYYGHYCTGENAEHAGLGHLLFACYASFPLLLSPGLANYLWLNFQHYADQSGSKRIARVAVSDFLLSPLVRQVARRQFEVIPDIRNYLLQLLQDESWFRLFGITFGEVLPLKRLAKFLTSYTQNERSLNETNAANFRELNSWAALAYLAPGELTVRVGRQLASAIADQDQSRQLRLNVLLDRIGIQAGLSPLKSNQKGKSAFMNLRNYSQGNRAQLFQETEEEISKYYNRLNDSFLAPSASQQQVSLPISGKIGERLNRRKEGRVRVFPVYIHVNRDAYDTSHYGNRVGFELEETLRFLESESGLFDLEPFTRFALQELNEDVFKAIEAAFHSSNPEDVVLVYYYGHSAGYRNDALPYLVSPESQIYDINSTNFQQRLSAMKGSGGTPLLILDSPTLGYAKWITGGIQLMHQETSISNPLTEKEGDFSSVFVELLHLTRGRITYGELARLMPYYSQAKYGRNTMQPLLTTDVKFRDLLFLSNRREKHDPDQFLIVYDRSADLWRVVEEDFKMVTRNTLTKVFTFEGELLNEASGELFVRDDRLTFGTVNRILDPDKIYRVQPEKPKLHIDLKYMQPNSDPASFFKSLSGLKRNGFSLWAPVPVINEDRYGEYLLEVLGNKDNGQLNWHYSGELSNNGAIISRNMDWQSPLDVDPGQFIQKFTQFEYLCQLEYRNLAPDKQKPLTSGIDISWKDGDTYHQVMDPGRFLINEECFAITNGQLQLKTLRIGVHSLTELPLFCDIYLMGDDLSITRLNKQTLVILKKMLQLELRHIDVLERLIDKQTSFYLKVLYSSQPILVNFSQEGLKDVSNSRK